LFLQLAFVVTAQLSGCDMRYKSKASDRQASGKKDHGDRFTQSLNGPGSTEDKTISS